MIQTNPKRSDEPVWWGLFGAGGSWFAMVSPITILVVGILVPMGILNPEIMSYAHMIRFASHTLGALFIIGTLSLPMWHAMHRVHHGMHDLKIHTGNTGKIVSYGLAFSTTIFAIVFALII
ncbi:Fumarate reductase subunit D [Vibrio aerogenes CECT 7868]|uniref:Fumarate reductase subunit D n=1 Tax=Vibrio aerogenes CECT 7868 TaxID=1216006 RepID=A0A1M5ZLS2_9VIBR|nr:fumarate reductase subunit FrdD [Vibrio aerogenes]SHI25078.1 Fumarate reductase subunit D [Vibrio aerogenes CECT 7868]